MSAFFDYVSHITYYLVFMALVGVIAPSGNYKKYIALIMGVVLIGIVLSPLEWDEIPVTELFAQIIPEPVGAEGFTDWQHEQVQTAFHGQLHLQAETLLARNGFDLISSEWETSADFSQIERVTLTVQSKLPTPTRTPFIRVEPIRISNEPATEEDALPIKTLIADFYNMSMDNIHVRVTN